MRRGGSSPKERGRELAPRLPQHAGHVGVALEERRDVGRYAIDTIAEGLASPAGAPDADGRDPSGMLLADAADRLAYFASLLGRLSRASRGPADASSGAGAST
jgi:hypothetical protein